MRKWVARFVLSLIPLGSVAFAYAVDGPRAAGMMAVVWLFASAFAPLLAWAILNA